jgi:uncharacterized membrane protein
MNKKYIKFFLLEILGLPLLATLLAYNFPNRGYNSSTVPGLPSITMAGLIENSMRWFFTFVLILSIVNVITSLVSLIIVSKNDKRIIIKKYLIYSLISMFIAIISWLLISASTQCLGCGGSATF